MHYVVVMRTTLAIDDDVLNAARAIAVQTRTSVGEVISDLARRSITQAKPDKPPEFRNGILLLPLRKGVVVTTEQINALRDELP